MGGGCLTTGSFTASDIPAPPSAGCGPAYPGAGVKGPESQPSVGGKIGVATVCYSPTQK